MEAARERPQAAEEVSWGECKGDDLSSMPSCKDDKLSYRRLRLLGQGSFGKAFLARDLANNELCVMKQVRVEKMDAKARDTAVREAVALRRVHHPNVVRFRQVFVRSGWLCLVMDFADGGDLCAAVKERARSKIPFEENAVLECFSQVADAVNFVHSQKMVHRDIKSRNVFLCRTGRALLGDFGLVRLLESTCELAHTRVGTPYYLSPEIIRKQPYNYKTDIWSLGVLLYEMSALTRPFVGTLETLPKAILKGVFPPLGKHYSQGLHDLVKGMLEVDPLQRLDLNKALQEEVLAAPLQRSRDALGLEPPEVPEGRSKRSDRIRKEIHESAEQMQSEWMGYATMIKRSGSGGGSGGPILPVSKQGETGTTAATASPNDEDGNPLGWSTAPQHNPDSGDEDLDDCSSDSWGSVVDTGVEAVAKAAEAPPVC
mmetsp:Transcript_11352/g.30995  ORF Transcript_11352/g.30995 Transcript_11352/m.30995 type:complete len:429 (-) Transcript_11352:35-1321(-)|eukprot:CAMPEP_0171187122 /NCGR_PEP_ID=MMETSP0790-20130122/17158_1 /TAXON_ID=2925 /ORGANISM="Alexandrium catenella, Strain OF101" /LENGTH=428 /DNA_ID=CAMNT_0011652173 /DNA_START=93 /DNA_END=1379 /DNA_ORIENTATION=+